MLRASARSCPVLHPALAWGVPASTLFAVRGVLKASAALHARRWWALHRAAWPAGHLPATRLCPHGALWQSPCPSMDCPRAVTARPAGWQKTIREGDPGFLPLGALPGDTPHSVLCLGWKGMGNLGSWSREGCKNRHQ